MSRCVDCSTGRSRPGVQTTPGGRVTLVPPPGVQPRRPVPPWLVDWHVDTGTGTWLAFRLHPPTSGAPWVEVRTGVAGFGPDLHPTELRRFGRTVNSLCQTLADALEPRRDDPQLALFEEVG